LHHLHKKYDLLENKDRSGVAPKAPEQTKLMMLELQRINYRVSGQKSPEEMFMMSQMAPACHSRYITNDYYLNVNIKYDACNVCCSKVPNVSFPLTIVPMTNPATYGFMEPQGYMPQELGYFKFIMT